MRRNSKDWKVVEIEDEVYKEIPFGKLPSHIAIVDKKLVLGDIDNTPEYDASLISKAPEMRNILEVLLSKSKEFDSDVDIPKGVEDRIEDLLE